MLDVSAENGIRILVVEETAVQDRPTGKMLEGLGYEICGPAATVEEAFETAGREAPDLVLMDIGLSRETAGREAAVRLRDEFDIPLILLAAEDKPADIERAARLSSSGCLVRPFNKWTLENAVRAALNQHRLAGRLRDSEEFFGRLFQEMHTGFSLNEVVTDESGRPCDFRFLDVNPAVEKITGYKREELVGKTLYEVAPRAGNHWIDTFSQVALTGKPRIFVYYSEILDKYLEFNAFSPRPGQFAVLFTDVTERVRSEEHQRRLEIQLRQAQKREALGTLAGGIAHDFNNILQSMILNAEILLSDLPDDPLTTGPIKSILKGGQRAKELVKQILVFSRQSDGERVTVDVVPIFKESLKLLRASLPATITIQEHFETKTDSLVTDPAQIRQLITKLCTNAAYAMRETGGTLEVRLAREDIGSPGAGGLEDLKPGPYLVLEVSDTGCGMNQTTLERIFDPFFTTKPRGEGTGMGLAMVHGIVKSHEGAITVKSEPGRGTRFKVYLPRVASPAAPEPPVFSRLPRGSERVLVVDDEAGIRESLGRILGRLGYEVTALAEAAEVLDLYRDDPDRFDLVITDQTMPRMMGSELARELMRLKPGLPIILCTGFSETITEEEAKQLGIREFLLKPIIMQELAETVRLVLES